MRAARPFAACLLLTALAVGRATAADAPARPPAPPPVPDPTTVVEVPADAMDVLVAAKGRGMLLTYREYRELVDAAEAATRGDREAPPVDAVRVHGQGTLDLTDPRAARFQATYRVEGLAPGTRSIGFQAGGLALERVTVEPEAGAGPARYEEREGGLGRIRLDGPGTRTVSVVASAVPGTDGASRVLDLWVPSPAAFGLTITLPPGVAATVAGEGPPLSVRSLPQAPSSLRTRPGRDGHLVVRWAQAASAAEGPSVLDADVKSSWTVGASAVALRALVAVDVLRTPSASVVLEVPADLAVHAVDGPGVTGAVRSDDRRRLVVSLEKPTLGRVELLVEGEQATVAGPAVEMPRVSVVGALRHEGEAVVRFGPDVRGRGVRVEGGRRVEPAPPPPPSGPPPRGDAAARPADPTVGGTLRYVLARADATVRVDVEPARLAVDATSAYYLSLADAGQTLIATVTYRVVEGTLFRLRPRFPREFDLRELTVDGAADGFARDVTADGGVEVALARGAPAGRDVVLVATLERARADWLPERDHVAVSLAVPSAGAGREDGYVAVGADAGFEVLDTGAKDLVAVGAADLAARGLATDGLVYGWRLDGPVPSLTLDVVRRTPLVEASTVTVLHPGARRVDLAARAVYRVQRAGVRRFFLDLPASAGDQVSFDTPSLQAATRLVGALRPADVPPGYERWQVDLARRVVGTHVVAARWFLDRDADEWTLAASDAVAARVPVDRSERVLVVRRSPGLEVALPGLDVATDLRTLDLTELPPEAPLDPQGVLEVIRLPATRDGVAVAVTQHAGAAVLDAIATEVALTTAVGKEGVLRTRAEVALVNVDRQFVQVALPPRSTLVGAVVDGVPVKPLVDPRGVLLVTVRSTVGPRGGRDVRSLVALTFDTDLGGPPSGRVRVEGPRFPGLEVLHTTHEVAVEDDWTLTAVRGDFLPRGGLDREARTPWLAAFLSATARGGAGGEAMTASNKEVSVGAEGYAQVPGKAGSVPTGPAGSGAAPPRPTRVRRSDLPPAPPVAPTAATPAPAPVPAEQPPPESSVPATPMTLDGAATDEEPGRGDDGHPALREPSDPTPEAPSGGPDRDPAHDLASAARAAGAGRRATTRALLSLDVPVALGPHVVRAARVGGGGAIEVTFVSDAADEATYRWVGLGVGFGGLALAALAGIPGLFVVLAGFLAALAVRLAFGGPAATVVAGVADASTALAGVLLLRWVVRRLAGGPRAARSAAGASTVALLVAVALGAAAPARAEDAPAPSAEDGGGRVFLPAPGASATGLAPDARVFVPLEVWRELERRAHPERDPELAADDRFASLVEARYRVEVGPRTASGTARLVLSQRGRGVVLVAVPMPGLAVRSASLDGRPVPLLLDGDAYRVPLDAEGDHVLELRFDTPVVVGPDGRAFHFAAPTSVVGTLDVVAPGFDGELAVSSAGRVEPAPAPDGGGVAVRAYLGRPVAAARVHAVVVTLSERRPADAPTRLATRAESRTIHSLRDGGTETVVAADVVVLQGAATAVELALPAGVDVLEAAGPEVERWETAAGRLRLVLRAPATGRIAVRVRAFRPAASPEREEAVPELAVLGVTGESGTVVVNADPSLRAEAAPGAGLVRTARPADADGAGGDGAGRVLGAWRFAARPAVLAVRTTRGEPRLEARTQGVVTFGDDHVRATLSVEVDVARAPVGELTFSLPGDDEVRTVACPGLEAWWLEGAGEARRLHVRTAGLVTGARTVQVTLDRRLGGARERLVVPRAPLLGAQADRGVVVLRALPDVEPVPTPGAGVRSLPPSSLEGVAEDAVGARATHAFAWDAAGAGPLTVALRSPDHEAEAVVVTQVAPSDEEQRLEHLVVFDVRRGTVDRVRVFVPDGGLASDDVVRTRDLRELRTEKTTRPDADGKEVAGVLYTASLQSKRRGVVEVTVSQRWPAGMPVRVVRPEDVKATRWFGLVRTFLDGEVDVKVAAGAPDAAAWADLPFVPTGIDRTAVLRTFSARAPYVLATSARRHRIEAQSDAVVLAARAEAVVGLDGDARVRVHYRLFNRSRQFLRVRLPDGVVLYGASAAGAPVKPLAASEGRVLLPVPKVPLGGTGYEVTIAYRAPAGASLVDGGRGTLPLPEIEGVEVDRTAVTLRLPDGFEYAFDTRMTSATARDVTGDDVEASLREAQEVLTVAETGTLEQRALACENAAPLMDQAAARLASWKQQGAASGKAASVEAELARLRRVQEEARARCAIDAGEAARREAFDELGRASNAPSNGFLLFSGDGDGARRASGAPAGAPPAASWAFNGEDGDAAAPVSKDAAELKGRLRTELVRRDLEEQRKKAEEPSAGEDAKQAGGEYEKRQTLDTAKNVGLVNDQLSRARYANRAPTQDGGAMPQSATRMPPQAGGGTAGERERDRERAGLPSLDGALADATVTRAGLMGVDVPLPSDGRTFWFVAARAGSSITFDASRAGASGFVRVLGALAMLAAVGVGLALCRRRSPSR